MGINLSSFQTIKSLLFVC